MFDREASDPAAFGRCTRELLHRRELAMTRHRAALARTLGVSEREMLAISHLAQHGALPPAGLAGLLGLSSGGATALVQRMEEAGHVLRENNPADRRSVLIRLSPKLVRRAERAYAPLVAELQRLAEEVPAQEQPAVTRFLQRVARLSEEHAERAVKHASAHGRDAESLPFPGLWG